MSRLVGGPFDGREFDAKGHFFKIPCRTFYASPPGREPYIAHTVAVYEPVASRSKRTVAWTFQREEVEDDGYVAPPQVKP